MTKSIFSACLTVLMVALSYAGPMDLYDSKSFKGSSKEINPYYTGPLCATGGALSDINKYIEKMDPTIIGKVEPNQISLLDTSDLIYTFKRVRLYEVENKKEGLKFCVLHIKAKMNNVPYEIVVELRGNITYDRILRIYQNGKPHTVVLWKDLNSDQTAPKKETIAI